MVRFLIAGLCLGLLSAQAQGASAQEQSPAAQLGVLHDALHLTPEQEVAWRDYVASLQPDPQIAARHRATEQLMPQVPTPRRIALIEATMAADAEQMHRQGQAVIAFYNRLNPDQQRLFDVQSLPAQDSGEGASDGRPLQMPPGNPRQ
jgi:hypothetical protein